MTDRWQNRVLALLAGGLLGVLLIGRPNWVIALVLLSLILLVIAGQRWHPRDFWGKVYYREWLLLAVTLVTGFVYGWSAAKDLPEPLVVENLGVEAVVCELRQTPERLETVIELVEILNIGEKYTDTGLNPSELLGKYQLNVYADKQQEWLDAGIQPGDRISVTVRLEWVKPQGTPGGFDPQLYYHLRGLKGKLSLKNAAQLIERGKPPLTWLIRQEVRQQLERFDPQTTGILEGILFGDTTNISAQDAEKYRMAGVWHVFAASGSNVAFVLALSWMLLRLASVPKAMRIGLTIAVLILYALLCGGNAPIVRATILGIAALLGMFGRGQVDGKRLLWLAAAGMFIFKPLWLKDIGFQMSFAATWGILVLAPRLLKEKAIIALPKVIRTPAAVAIAAQLAVLPLLMVAFHRVSLIGFVTNVFILFILGAVLEIGLIGVILSPFIFLAAPFFQVGIWLLQATDMVLSQMVRFPLSDVWVVNPGSGFFLFWYLAVGIYLIGTKKVEFILRVWWGKLWGWLSSTLVARRSSKLNSIGSHNSGLWRDKLSLRWLAMGILLLLIISPWRSPDVLRVSFIDVGQGDAILLQGPGNQAILIDSGPAYDNYNTGEKVIIPYLLHRGIKSLDGLILTHEHEDHTGGAKVILETIPTGWVAIPETDDDGFETGFADLLPATFAYGSEKLIELREGDQLKLNDAITIDVLAPSGYLRGTRSDANNNSIVLNVRYGSIDLLLTGDIELEGLTELSENGYFQIYDIDVFKVPHHGSRYSYDEKIWNEFSPQMVVIPVGKNSFGHPAKEVVTHWQEREVPVYRTDVHGTIELEIDEESIRVKTGR